MRVIHLVLLALLALNGVARAQEEDDDPKAKPTAAAKARAAEKKSDAKAKADPAVKPDAKTKADAAATKADAAAAKADAAAAKADAKAKTEAKGDPKGDGKSDSDGKPMVKRAAADKIADDAPPPGKKPKALPKLARASEPVPDPLVPLAESPVARSVRVRLVDGSTVVGSVRAEQVDALVVDCSLGQLAIPRSRISTIAYDSAAGVGTKRAPVQQLDDDVPAPKKRSSNQ